MAPRVVTAAYGESVTVLCQYNRQYLENTKYWCRGKIFDVCTVVVKTSKLQSNDRVSISEDKKAQVFSVTMTSLTDSDEGLYWCAIRIKGRDIHKAVWLNVSHTGNSLTINS